MKKQKQHIIITGGGTGGHIYPAIATGTLISQKFKNVNVTFVGAKGKIEMNAVPKAGFKIIGLWITGMYRKEILRNLLLPLKILISIIKSFFILINYRPKLIIGFGGYASFPLLFVAALLFIPFFIYEANSYAGLTNKILGKFADKVCVANPEMSKFFDSKKIAVTGYVVRNNLFDIESINKNEAFKYFNLESSKKTLFIVGGSLGAKSINEGIEKIYQELIKNDIQVLWQTGKLYYERIIANIKNHKNATILPYIDNMNYAYCIADVVVSRAGASSISELIATGKATIFIPSPNVAEDHQTKNAINLVKNNAAWIVEDKNLDNQLYDKIMSLINDDVKLKELAMNMKNFIKMDYNKIMVELVKNYL